MTLEAILFDVDGTLAETEEVHRQCFNAAFEEFETNWMWDPHLYAELLEFSGGKSRLHHYAAQYHPNFYHRPGGKDLVNDIYLCKVDNYVRRVERKDVSLRPGVRRLLEEAREEGLRLAIVTSSSPKNVAPFLEATIGEEALGWFEVVAAGDCVKDVKPSPDIYAYTLSKMELSPEVCIAIEDTGNGLRSSSGAGVATVITTHHYSADDDFSGAAAVLSHLGEPDMPFEVLQGDGHGASYVDVGLLRLWRTEANGR